MNIITLQIPLAPDRYLEGRLLFSAEASREEGVILCPPHPLLAGNMDNNIVQAVANLVAQSKPVLLFNYQAVGKSYKPRPVPLFEHWQQLDQHNDFSRIIAETQATITYSSRYFPKLHMVGYSFGAFIGHHCLTPDCLSFTAIAPPLAEHDFSSPQFDIPAMTIWAEKDALLAPSSTVYLSENALHREIKDTDHFFIKHEAEVAKLVADFIGA